MPQWKRGAVGAAAGAKVGSMILPGIGTGVGAGIGGLWGLFSRGDKDKDKEKEDAELDPYTKALQQSSQRLSTQGQDLTSQGGNAMQQVMAYLQKLAGGDPAAVMDATKQSRGRVIDQYDSAKRSVANFTPRGGGSAAAMGDLETSKANQLSDILSSKQDEAVGQLASVGATTAGLGLSAQQLASSDLETIIRTIMAQKGLDMEKRGQNMGALAGAGEGLGSLLGLLLTRKAA